MASFVARSLMVIVPLLPHGVFEVLGYSLIALAGVRYHSNGDYVRVLVIGFVFNNCCCINRVLCICSDSEAFIE